MTATEEYPQVSDRAHIQRFYEKLRREGQSHSLAEMFAFQQPPMSDTDREFLEGQGGCYDQFPGEMAAVGDFYRKKAEAAGVNITGKVYKSSLANEPGDVRAWVSSKDDVKRICEERGMGCTGAVNVPLRTDVKPKAKIPIADDLVAEAVEARIDENPDLAHKKDLWEETREAIKPAWADKD